MRKIVLSVIAALALAVGLLAAQPATAAGRYKVSIKVSTKKLPKGGTLLISGKVSPKAKGKVTMQKKVGNDAWVTDNAAKIKKDGTYLVKERPTTTQTRLVRICKSSGGGKAGGCSKAVRIKISKKSGPTTPKAPKGPTSLTVTNPGPREVTAGQTFEIDGTATGLAGQPLQLQKLSGTAWNTLGTGAVGANGAWHLSVAATQGGQNQQLRVYAPTSGAQATAGAYTVLVWYRLRDLTRVQDGYGGSIDAVNISGGTYADSYYFSSSSTDPQSYRDSWDLRRSCRTVRTVVGLTDTSNSEARWNVTFRADDVVRNAQNSVALGETRQVTFDVTSALRLNVEPQHVSGSGNSSYLALGNPQVLCAFP